MRPLLLRTATSLALAALACLLALAFAWPAVRTAPRALPLGVVAAAPQQAEVAGMLERAQPGAFTVRPYADEAAARTAIGDREVYGAIVLVPDGARVLTAPAASATVATVLDQVAEGLGAGLAQASGSPVPPSLAEVVPVAALPADDPRGAGFAAMALPLVIGSIAIGVITTFVVAGTWAQVGVVLGAAAVAGIGVTAICGGWLGIVPGFGWAEAGLLALAYAASGLALVGARALLGRAGLALVAPVLLLVGNPLSAATSAPEMLPGGWAGLGQALPPGALVTALRGVAFFDGAGAVAPALVLTAWAAGGLLLAGLAALAQARGGRVIASTSSAASS